MHPIIQLTIPHLYQLHSFLDPESYALLARAEPLPEAGLQMACEQARKELRAIARYIPSRIVQQQILDPQPGKISAAYWNGTILLADLSGFTAMSAQLSSLGKQGAEEISTIINQLFEDLVSEIHRFSGALLKFGGDALTAFFVTKPPAALAGKIKTDDNQHLLPAIPDRLFAPDFFRFFLLCLFTRFVCAKR